MVNAMVCSYRVIAHLDNVEVAFYYPWMLILMVNLLLNVCFLDVPVINSLLRVCTY